MEENIDPHQTLIETFYVNGIKNVEQLRYPFDLFPSVKSQFNDIDQFIDMFLSHAKQGGQPCDCHEGCDWCCHQEVFALEYEISLIVEFMQKTFSEETIDSVFHAAKGKLELTKDLDQSEWEKKRIPCPLLVNGSCSVYTVRPMGCRIYLSSSEESCKQNCLSPQAGFYPTLYQLPLRCGQMMNEGFVLGLKNKGQNILEFSIEQGLVTKLEALVS